MKLVSFILLLGIALMFTGCGEPAAGVATPKRYDKNGLTFQYPGNWKIEEDEELEGGVHHLILETDGDALVVMQLFPTELASSLAEYAREFSTESNAALPIGRMMDSKFTPLPEKAGFTRLQENFSIKLLSERILHVRRYGSRDFAGKRCFLICQVAAEDLAKVEAGFDQIEASVNVTALAKGKAP